MMPKLLAIAESLVLEQVLARSFSMPKKSRAGVGLFALAGLLLVVALGFFITAFHAWVSAQYTPDVAALITASAVLALAIIAALTGMSIMHQRTLRLNSVKHEMKHNLETVLKTFDDELGDHVRDNPATALALAGLAGFILGDHVI